MIADGRLGMCMSAGIHQPDSLRPRCSEPAIHLFPMGGLGFVAGTCSGALSWSIIPDWRNWWDFGWVTGRLGCHQLSTVFKALNLTHPISVEASSIKLFPDVIRWESSRGMNFRGEMPGNAGGLMRTCRPVKTLSQSGEFRGGI